MELQLSGGGKSVSVSDAVFDRPFNQALVHQVVTAYLAGGRSGTKAQKNRGDVRGGGKKPWRQKGTGRARAGTIRSPIWAGGGVTFAATPRDFAQKVNRKMYRAGLRSIFSELARSGRLKLIEDVATAQRKTKALVQALSERGCQPDGVLVVKDLNDDLGYSARNLPHLSVVAVRSLNPAMLVNVRQVIVTEDARNALEEWLG